MAAFSHDKTSMSSSFTENEILKQLEALGYRNIPASLIREFKQDLDEIVEADMRAMLKPDETKKSEPRSFYTGNMVQRSSNGVHLIQTNFKNDLDHASNAGRLQTLPAKTSSDYEARIDNQQAKTKKLFNQISEESSAKEANDAAIPVSKPFAIPQKSSNPKLENLRFEQKCDKNTNMMDIESRMTRMSFNESNNQEYSHFRGMSKDTSYVPKRNVVPQVLHTENLGFKQKHDYYEISDDDSNPGKIGEEDYEQSEEEASDTASEQGRRFSDVEPNRRGKFCTVCKDDPASGKNVSARSSVASQSLAQKSSARSNLTRAGVVYGGALKQPPFEKNDPVKKFASYRAAWSSAQSSYAGLFGDGSHRQLRWTVRMMMKRVRDEAKEREQITKHRRAAARQQQQQTYATARTNGTRNWNDSHRDRQLRLPTRSSTGFPNAHAAGRRDGQSTRGRTWDDAQSDSSNSEDDEDYSDDNDDFQEPAGRDAKPNRRRIEHILQPYFYS